MDKTNITFYVWYLAKIIRRTKKEEATKDLEKRSRLPTCIGFIL